RNGGGIMAKRRAKTKKRKVSKRKPHRAKASSDVTTYLGVAIVRDLGRRRTETLIVSDLRAAELLGLTSDEMALAKYVLAGGVRKCKGISRGGQVMCANMGGCTHKCHLYRAKLPIPPDGLDPEDLGENERDLVDKEKGYGYWCSCD